MMMMQLDSPMSSRSVRAKEVSPVKSITYLVSSSNTRQLLKYLLLVASLSGPETFAPVNNSTIAAAASSAPAAAATARRPNREPVADRLSDWLLSERRSAGADLWAKQQLDSYPDTITAAATGNDLIIDDYRRSPCQLVPVVHVLHQTGCHAKAIDSFACVGSCSSYVQVSSSKFWQRERSCSCCQQTGLKEATFTLDCPSLTPPYRKVKTFAPVECLCRSCTDLNRENLQPQELVEAMMMNQQI